MTDKPTDAEIVELMRDGNNCRYNDEADHVEFARAVLAKWGTPAVAGEPFGYFHQLLNHEGKGNGVWLGAAERKVVEQAHTPGETSEEIVALYTTPQPTRPDPAYSEACNLATALFKKHFAHLPDYASGQVVWGLFDSTEGVILQIDNMVSGLVQPPTTSPQADSVQEDAARYRWLRNTSNADDPSHMIALHIRDEQNDASLSGIDAAIDIARKQGEKP